MGATRFFLVAAAILGLAAYASCASSSCIEVAETEAYKSAVYTQDFLEL